MVNQIEYYQSLIGNINLTNVNLRPDKVNQILQSLTIPFSLRAGTITHLDLKVTIFTLYVPLGKPSPDVDWADRDHNR